MLVPTAHVGLLIGRDGETIRHLREQSGASIDVPYLQTQRAEQGEHSAQLRIHLRCSPRNFDHHLQPCATGAAEPLGQKLVEITGEPNCVAAAKAMIDARMRSTEMRSSASGPGMGPEAAAKESEVIGVAPMHVDWIVENSGSTIQRIQSESVRILPSAGPVRLYHVQE